MPPAHDPSFDVAIIGCGSIGLATAYYLALNHGATRIALIDCGQPMAFTSAQSGENYRNWWPHPAMVAMTNRSIDLLEDIARHTNNQINMTRRGYALATRERRIDSLVEQLHTGLGDEANRLIRYHDDEAGAHYQPPHDAHWQAATDGVDILTNPSLIRTAFPTYASDIKTVIHIRRGGDISGQQLGTIMLDHLKAAGAQRVTGTVTHIIKQADSFVVDLQGGQGPAQIKAGRIVNAAGPFAGKIAAMLDVSLPVFSTFQQKIAFEDRSGAIDRTMPFSIDLDPQQIDWEPDERALLLEDPHYRWLAETMPGAIHCRPDGGDQGSWIKLGWAYNQTPAEADWQLPLDENFPDIVLRGAARLNPALKHYYGQLPRQHHHYGGWYTLTDENWPLVGPMGVPGAFMNCAMSGFGTMSACAMGELCAAWVAEATLPAYSHEFSLQRYNDESLMHTLRASNKGIL